VKRLLCPSDFAQSGADPTQKRSRRALSLHPGSMVASKSPLTRLIKM
jgi:hypothetical protein